MTTSQSAGLVPQDEVKRDSLFSEQKVAGEALPLTGSGEAPARGPAFFTTAQTHRVWRLGADIDTDLLAPGYVMQHGIDTIARHCLESVRPEFARGVRPGDVIVAGPNFGIGSSREQAASVLVRLGVAAVIAPSYGGLYFRNAFNLGLMLLTCPDVDQIRDGSTVRLRLDELPCVTDANGRHWMCEPIPSFLVDMARHGGLFNQLKTRLARERDHDGD